MKKLYFLTLIMSSNLLLAQSWGKLETNLSHGTTSSYIELIDKNTVWAVHDNGFFIMNDLLTVSRTIDGGSTFTTSTVSSEMGDYCTCLTAVSANVCWLMTVNIVNGGGKIFVTKDGGQTWQRKGLNTFGFGGSFPDVIDFTDATHGFALGDPADGEYEIYTTADGGENWARVASSKIPHPTPGEFGLTESYAIKNGKIFCGTSDNRLLTSSDGGLNWQVQNLPAQSNAFAVYSIAFSDNLNGMAMYNYNNGQATPTPGAQPKPLRTTDGGLTWTVISNSNLSNFDEFGQLTFVPGTTSTFICGNYDGWAYTKDYGVTWNYYENKKYRIPSIKCVDWQTCYGGLWDEFGDTDGDVVRFIGGQLAPDGLNLPTFKAKLWPNPTYNDLNVSLYSPYNFDIACYLQDIVGNNSVVASGIIPAGSTSTLMNVSTVKSGVYSLRMIVGSRVQSQIVFVKMY